MNPLLRWALDRASTLSLSPTEVRGLERFGLFDYRVELSWLGHRCEGRGTDAVAELALVKAIAECVEAALIRHHGLPNSNGVAAHPDLERARLLSARELYERDLWMCHYLTRTPLRRLETDHPLHAECVRQNTRFDFYESRKSERGSTVLAVARGDRARAPFGLVAGLGFQPEPDRGEATAIQKAWVECARTLLDCWDPARPPGAEALSLAQFSSLSRQTPREHGSWGLSLEAIPTLFPWIDSAEPFRSEGLAKRVPSHESMNRYRILNEPPASHEGRERPPIHVVQCENARLQGLSFGMPKPESVNLERLSEFAGRPFSLSEMNPLPHPIA